MAISRNLSFALLYIKTSHEAGNHSCTFRSLAYMYVTWHEIDPSWFFLQYWLIDTVVIQLLDWNSFLKKWTPTILNVITSNLIQKLRAPLHLQHNSQFWNFIGNICVLQRGKPSSVLIYDVLRYWLPNFVFFSSLEKCLYFVLRVDEQEVAYIAVSNSLKSWGSFFEFLYAL